MRFTASRWLLLSVLAMIATVAACGDRITDLGTPEEQGAGLGPAFAQDSAKTKKYKKKNAGDPTPQGWICICDAEGNCVCWTEADDPPSCDPETAIAPCDGSGGGGGGGADDGGEGLSSLSSTPPDCTQAQSISQHQAYCEALPPSAAQRDRLNAAFGRMDLLGGACTDLATGRALLGTGELKIFADPPSKVRF